MPAAINGHVVKTPSSPQRVRLQETVGLQHSVAVIVSLVVGTGIYLSPQGIVQHAGSVGLSLLIWLLSGVIATLGALVFAELGTTFPGSGAHYVYLERMYGPLPAFLYLWTMIFLVRPGMNAIKALVFAQYVVQPIFGECDSGVYSVILVAASLAVILGYINIVDVKLALKGQTMFFVITLLTLLLISVTGIVWICRGKWEMVSYSFEGSTSSPVELLFSLYYGTFAYAGWYCINVLAEELKEPKRDLPRALAVAMTTVTVLYMLVNLAYFAVLGTDGVLSSKAVAASFASQSLGLGVWFIAVCIAFNTAGSTNVGIMVASRLCFVGARRGHLPECLSLIHIKFLSPITGIIFQVLLCVLLCIFTTNVMWLIKQVHAVVLVMDTLVVAGMIYLRWRQPDLKRPFKLPLAVPCLYLLCTLVMTIVPMVTRPRDSAMGVLFILATALPYYCVAVLWKKKLPKSWNSKAGSFTRLLQKLLLATPQDIDL